MKLTRHPCNVASHAAYAACAVIDRSQASLVPHICVSFVSSGESALTQTVQINAATLVSKTS